MSTHTPTPSPRRHPLSWVPSLYLAMGLPNVTVGVVAAILFKNLGMANEDIALYTSQMYLPWVLKPLWAPLLEPFKTKRWWVITMQFLMMASIGAVAFCLPLDGFFRLSLAFFWITGFASATQDIVADGVYMTTLPLRDQARYAGLQGMCWNLGSVIASGLLVSLTGWLHKDQGLPWVQCWVIVMSGTALMMGGFGLLHLRTLPPGEPSAVQGQGFRSALPAMRESWRTFFQKPQIWMMLAVIFSYRFAEGFVERFGPLFLLDPRSVGGLGLDNKSLGFIYGTTGTLCYIAGAFISGFIVARWTLPRTLFILAVALNLPHVTYWIMAHTMPTDMLTIGVLVAVEKFGFGMGAVGQIIYMMQQVAPGPFRMTHYAFATGVMAMTKWSTGTLSAWAWAGVGHDYKLYFTGVLIISAVPVLLVWWAPFPHKPVREDLSR